MKHKTQSLIMTSTNKISLYTNFAIILLVQVIIIELILFGIDKALIEISSTVDLNLTLYNSIHSWFVSNGSIANNELEWLKNYHWNLLAKAAVYIIISLILIAKKGSITDNIKNQDVIKMTAKLHDIIIKSVRLESESRRMKGKSFTYTEVQYFIKGIYNKDQSVFLEVFKISGFPGAPYTGFAELFNFMYTELKQYIREDVK